MDNENMAIIMCPPLSLYPEQPSDISKCELVDCPKCNEKMWLSEKKKEWEKISMMMGKEILKCCFNCLKKIVRENPEMIKSHVRVDI